MPSLDIEDAGVDAVCAWYSIVHVPDESLAQVFSEFHRVLAPDGHLLLAFQVGEQPRELGEAFGDRVALTFYRRRPAAVVDMLAASSLNLYAQLVREPDDDGLESTSQAYLIGRKSPLE